VSISYCVISTTNEQGDMWYGVVDKWHGLRPEWKHQTRYDDTTEDFACHYFNIEIKDKKDLFDLIRLAHDLIEVQPDLEMEWHNKVKDANISFQTREGSFRVYGGPIISEIVDRTIMDIKKIKDIIKNY
jgi:hypothetical protein